MDVFDTSTMKGVPDRYAFSFPIQMASQPKRLPNYLRMYRRRACLTQAEVARLLGNHDGANVSRYERYKRKPSLETALGFCAIFREPITELLAGTYDDAARVIRGRTRQLALKVRQTNPTRRTILKLESLDRISNQ